MKSTVNLDSIFGGVVLAGDYIKYDLKRLEKGQTVEVALTRAANVRLMTLSNFNKYKNGKNHKYYGGLVKRSPYRITVPSSGHWFLTVDMFGLRGTTKVNVRILPAALPTAKVIREPLSPSLIQNPSDFFEQDEVYDVFISHASEDKDEVVRPLAETLRDAGLKVWYDEFELHIGDSLRRKIDRGLAQSRFGIIILSRDFISKGWTNYELDGLMSRSIDGSQRLLPIWHNITKKEVIEYSPSLADKLARSTANETLEEIAKEIIELINEEKPVAITKSAPPA